MRWLVTWTVLVGACAATPSDGGGEGGNGVLPEGGAWLRDVVIPAHMERPGPELEAEIARRIGALHNDDFAAYSEAARRLVVIGTNAVPYLGHAGTRGGETRLVAIVLTPILRAATSEEVGLFLHSPYRPVRIAAAEACGERALEEHVPTLLDLLDDPELQVRRAGIAALRRLSNRFFGYRADAAPGARAEAIARWREFWNTR